MPHAAPLLDLLATQKAMPLCNCGDAATGIKALEALHAGGTRDVEFTNRSAGALDVFRLAEASLRAWFAAGVFCADMGSHPVDAETLKTGRFAELADRSRRLTAILATV